MRQLSPVIKDICVFGMILCIGCDQAQRAKSTADIAVYTAELTECRKKGKEAKSYDVYEACAAEADKKHKVDGR